MAPEPIIISLLFDSKVQSCVRASVSAALLCSQMLLFLLISTFAIASARLQADIFWKEGRKEFLKNKEARPVTHRPRNMIIFIGDGMSIPTITAARVLRAQRQGVWRSGRCPLLSFEDCPFVGLLKTANVDRLTADSSSTASALFTGEELS